MVDVNGKTPSTGGGSHFELRREFGRRLRNAREQRYPRPLQREWAEAMGLTDVRQYQRWEHGEQLPSMERLPKVIEVSGIDVSDLLEPAGSMSRDDLKAYFDSRLDDAILELKSYMEASFLATYEAIARMEQKLETRLHNGD